MAKRKIGLSLSGGGLKSFAQAAVLQDLEQHDIEPVVLAGTSMGSMMATLIANGYDGASLEKRALELEERFQKRKILKPVPNLRRAITARGKVDGLVNPEVFQEFCRECLKEDGVVMLSDVKKPLAIPAVDINTGALVVFTNRRESFREDPNWTFYPDDIEAGTAVAASCAFPLMISTISVGEHRFSDGGILMNSPVPLFSRRGLAGIVSVTTQDDSLEPVPKDGIKVMFRTIGIMTAQFSRIQNETADIVINLPIPREETFNVGTGRDIIELSKATLRARPVDYSVLPSGKWSAFLRQIFSKQKPKQSP
jgi:NTE family protein